jgi:hypothetical protein
LPPWRRGRWHRTARGLRDPTSPACTSMPIARRTSVGTIAHRPLAAPPRTVPGRPRGTAPCRECMPCECAHVHADMRGVRAVGRRARRLRRPVSCRTAARRSPVCVCGVRVRRTPCVPSPAGASPVCVCAARPACHSWRAPRPCAYAVCVCAARPACHPFPAGASPVCVCAARPACHSRRAPRPCAYAVCVCAARPACHPRAEAGKTIARVIPASAKP